MMMMMMMMMTTLRRLMPPMINNRGTSSTQTSFIRILTARKPNDERDETWWCRWESTTLKVHLPYDTSYQTKSHLMMMMMMIIIIIIIIIIMRRRRRRRRTLWKRWDCAPHGFRPPSTPPHAKKIDFITQHPTPFLRQNQLLAPTPPPISAKAEGTPAGTTQLS